MSIDRGFSPEFFRSPDTGKGGGGANSSELFTEKMRESFSSSDQLCNRLAEFWDLAELSPEELANKFDEFKSLNSGDLIAGLEKDLKFKRMKASRGSSEEQELLEKIVKNIADARSMHDQCVAIFGEGIVEVDKTKESGAANNKEIIEGVDEADLNQEQQPAVEKKTRAESLFERLDGSFIGIENFLKITSDMGGQISRKEADGLIFRLKNSFEGFYNTAIHRKFKREKLAKVSQNEEKLKKDSSKDEKESAKNELSVLKKQLDDPFLMLKESGFSKTEIDQVKKVYENYVKIIKNSIGSEILSDASKVQRAKKILVSPETLEFSNRLKEVLLRINPDSNNHLEKDELNECYQELLDLWRKTGINPEYFYEIASLVGEEDDGQNAYSGQEVYQKFMRLQDSFDEFFIYLADANGDITTFDFQTVADQIKIDNLDFFRFADSRDPGNEVDPKKSELLIKFKYWCFGSVFNNRHIVRDMAEKSTGLGGKLSKLGELDEEKNQAIFNLVYDLLRSANRGLVTDAETNKTELISEMKKLGFNEKQVNDWVVDIYKKVAELEVLRKEIKVDLQTHFVSAILEENNSAAGNRANLYDQWAGKVMRRDELLIATTYNPKYGWLIRDVLDQLMYVSSLNGDEVIVRRWVRRPTKNHLLPRITTMRGASNKPETNNTRQYEEVEIKQKVKASYADLKEAEAKNIPIALFLKEKLERQGEEVLYLPDYQNKLISYDSLAHSEKGRDNLGAAIDDLVRQINEQNPAKFADMSAGDIKKAKMFVDRLFFIFDYLTISLTDLQKNTRTRSHNGNDEGPDRIGLGDFIASVMHRKFRYPGNYGEAMSILFALMAPFNGSNNLYHKSESKKEFEKEEVYKRINGQSVKVDPEYEFYFGKASDTHEVNEGGQKKTKYIRKDSQHINVLQRLLWEFYEKSFDFIGKVPLIRQRGVCEALGFSTRQILFLNPEEWERSKKQETIWDFNTGIVDKNGKTVKDLKNIDDVIRGPKKENVTEFIHYITAEEKGFLGVIERLYAPTASGGLISQKELFSKKGIIDSWFKAWGRIKMFPSPVVREAFVTMSYFVIMKAIHVLEEIKGKNANAQTAELVWQELIDTLEDNLRDQGGLASYDQELATLINLFCESPLYGLGKNEDGKDVPMRIARTFYEDKNINDDRGIEYQHLPEIKPSKDCYDSKTNPRTGQRVKYVISNWLYSGWLKTRPNVTIERPEVVYDIINDRRIPKGLGKRIMNALKGEFGIQDLLIGKLNSAIRGDNTEYDRSPIPPKGEAMVQVNKEKD